MSNYAQNIISILAGLPEFLRKTMLKSRLEEFFNMSKEEKIEIINNVLDALPTIEQDILRRLTKTWLEVLDTFGNEKREEIFTIYATLLSNRDISKLDIEGLIKVLDELNTNVRENTLNSIRSVLNKLENREVILSRLPTKVKSLLY